MVQTFSSRIIYASVSFRSFLKTPSHQLLFYIYLKAFALRCETERCFHLHFKCAKLFISVIIKPLLILSGWKPLKFYQMRFIPAIRIPLHQPSWWFVGAKTPMIHQDNNFSLKQNIRQKISPQKRLFLGVFSIHLVSFAQFRCRQRNLNFQLNVSVQVYRTMLLFFHQIGRFILFILYTMR